MNIDIYQQIERLLQYGLKKKLIHSLDIDFTRNQLLDLLGLQERKQVFASDEELHTAVDILENMLDWAAEKGMLQENTITYRDLLDTKIMGCLLARPSEISREFYHKYETTGPIVATQCFYQLCKDIDYIRTNRIAKNERWTTVTDFGEVEITINLSKPEKDPRAIAAARGLKENSYPSCLLCKENTGYAGRVNHPARQTLRAIPVELGGEKWYFQFSPYVYYNEHAIILKKTHEPMEITIKTFVRIMEFTEKFPHYFLGSNADLPIVGGSILNHDHYQGGDYEFPMAKAEVEKEIHFIHFPGVKAGIIKWPMTIIRLTGKSREELSHLAYSIFLSWKEYSDERVNIHAFTDGTPHNTVTPIARRRKELFELDLVLRNNRTNEKYPYGIFHPHENVHHIKKENIGLIEVMGLAVLPGRLKQELTLLADCLWKKDYVQEIKKNELIMKHLNWAIEVKNRHPELSQENVFEILKREVGLLFIDILGNSGVFKRDKMGKRALERFCNILTLIQ